MPSSPLSSCGGMLPFLHFFFFSSSSPFSCELILCQVIFLLRELLYLDLPATAPDTPANNDENNTNNNTNSYKNTLPSTTPETPATSSPTINTATSNPLQSSIRSQHQHLIELYPLFCECITSNERDLKDLLKEIFYLVGKEFLSVKRL